MSTRFYNPRAFYTDLSGEPLAGGRLHFYISGTSTPNDIYVDPDLANPHANPIVLDSAGRLPNDVFLDPHITYKVVLANALGVAIWTADPVNDPHAQAITTLETRVTAAEGDIEANATALQSLDTRVTVNEDGITANSTAITSLEADVSDLVSGVSGNSTAINTLEARVTTTEGDIAANSLSITSLESDVTDLDAAVSGNSTAISSLDTRVTTAEGNITSNASAITSIQSDVTDLETGQTANASAISSLETEVSSLDGDVTANSTLLTTLFASSLAGESEGNIRFRARSAPSGVEARFAIEARASNGDSFSEGAMYLDVVAGGQSRITMLADHFRVTLGAEGLTPFEISGGKITLTGDVTINGNLLVTGSVQTAGIAAGAVSEVVTGSAVSINPSSSTPQDGADLTITLGADEKVILFVKTSAATVGYNVSDLSWGWSAAGRRDGVNVVSGTLIMANSGAAAHAGTLTVADDPGPGTYDYSARVSRLGTAGLSGGGNNASAELVIFKVKR